MAPLSISDYDDTLIVLIFHYGVFTAHGGEINMFVAGSPLCKLLLISGKTRIVTSRTEPSHFGQEIRRLRTCIFWDP